MEITVDLPNEDGTFSMFHLTDFHAIFLLLIKIQIQSTLFYVIHLLERTLQVC